MAYKDDDIDNWPRSWMGVEEDIEFGEKLVELFQPFIAELKETGRSERWVNRHVDNLWALGGIIIKHINIHNEDRKAIPCLLLSEFIDGIGGPRITDSSKAEQNAFNRTCVLFYDHLVKHHLLKLVGRDGSSIWDEE